MNTPIQRADIGLPKLTTVEDCQAESLIVDGLATAINNMLEEFPTGKVHGAVYVVSGILASRAANLCSALDRITTDQGRKQ